MKRKLIGFLLVIGCSMAMADDWILVSVTKNNMHEYYGLKGSALIQTNKSGEEIIVMTAKDVDKTKSTVTVEKLYVRTEDCLKKQGKGVVLHLDGNFKYDFDFVFGAGSIGSIQAQFICTVYRLMMEERDKKGI